MTQAETLYQPPEPLLESLQNGRYNLAVQAAERQVRGAFLPDHIEAPDVTISHMRYEGLRVDCGALRPAELMSLEALGIDAEEFVRGGSTDDVDTLAATVKIEDETLEIFRYREGMSMRFAKAGTSPDTDNDATPTLMLEKVRERFGRSPAHRELHRINQTLRESATTPPVVQTQPFDPMEDPLGTAAFLDQIGLTRSGFTFARQIREGMSTGTILQNSLKNVPSYKAVVTKDDKATTYTWGNAATQQLSVDERSGTFIYSVRANPGAAYLEKANSAPYVEAVPFIETECGRELCRLADRAGLMLHPKVQLKMMEVGESDRFGSVYTQLSREVAKWVDDPKRTKLSNLFVPADPEYTGAHMPIQHPELALYRYREQQENNKDNGIDIEATVREAWGRTDHTVEGEAAGVLVGMIDDVLVRDTAQPLPSDLPVTARRIRISNGACFDVAAYYVGAAGYGRAKDLRSVAPNGVNMLEKTHGAHTFLSLQPMVFNGVRLPKGSLFTRHEDAWAFIRLTPFTFDAPADQLALAPEISKVAENEKENIAALGGMSLRHIADGHGRYK